MASARRKSVTVTLTQQFQRRVEGGRIRRHTGFDPRVWAAVEKEARRYGVSIPFVLSVMAADTLGVPLEEQDRYRPNIRRVR